MKKIIVLLSIILLITGCGKKMVEGEVYEKEYRESREEFYLMPIISTNGKNMTTTYIPMWRHYPERFVIKIKDFDKKKDNWIYGEIFVKENVYDEINIGDWFKFDKDRDYSEEPYAQERRK